MAVIHIWRQPVKAMLFDRVSNGYDNTEMSQNVNT